jgi:hypothetical protein
VTKFSDWAIHFERMAASSKRYRVRVLKEKGYGYGDSTFQKEKEALEKPIVDRINKS